MQKKFCLQSLGNHEFGYYPTGLAPFLTKIQFPIVVANVDFSNEASLKQTNVKKSLVIEVCGKKIGIIGYVTPESFVNVYHGNITFTDEISAITSESVILHKKGVKTIIALGHSGYDVDQKIAENVPLVDLVVGGHSHTLLWTGSPPDIDKVQGPYPTVVVQKSGKKVPVIHSYAKTKYMGRLNIVINENGDVFEYSGTPQLLNSSVPQDENALELLSKYRYELDKLSKVIVGYSKTPLEGGPKTCRYKECSLPNLVTDAFVDYYFSTYSETSIGVISTRSLLSNVVPNAADEVSMLDVVHALPFNTSIWSLTLSGKDLLRTLENGVRHNEDTRYQEFIHTSGIQYSFNRTKPVGFRVVNAKAFCRSCKPVEYRDINPSFSYRITTTEVLVLGFDNHVFIKENGYDKVRENKTEIEVILRYLNKTIRMDAQVEGRITEIV